MDALYPRLLVNDFDACVRFYEAALKELLGIDPVKIVPEASYANWDLNGEATLALFGRKAIAAVVGADALPDTPTQDRAMLALRVENVDAAAERLVALGARQVAAPQDRPDWGPSLRTAHLRDPDGNLLELQSY
jgi:catechol 2,3-dioxygenase-like lactoylglutathione lyase family enzyme